MVHPIGVSPPEVIAFDLSVVDYAQLLIKIGMVEVHLTRQCKFQQYDG